MSKYLINNLKKKTIRSSTIHLEYGRVVTNEYFLYIRKNEELHLTAYGTKKN